MPRGRGRLLGSSAIDAHPRFVRSAEDGLRLATWDLGGDGPDLLVVHATGFHSLAYRALARELAERFHVVAVDLPGHGSSDAPPTDPDADGAVPGLAWERFGRDVLTVVDELGLDRPVGFGHSCGGATLLLAEAARPGTFRSIHGFEPVVFPPLVRPAGPESSLAVGARRRRRRFDSLQAAHDNYASKPPLSGIRDDCLWDYVEGGFRPEPEGHGVELRCAPEVEGATFDMAVRSTTWSHLGDVGCPVRITCGGPEGQFRIDVAAAVAAALGDGEATELAALTHFGPFEDPAAIAATIG